ncbi:hypothetical protein Lal_00001424 [Lupinus albus]|nr:hypothetical protein Lal_00001424 [Lupinus albus]
MVIGRPMERESSGSHNHSRSKSQRRKNLKCCNCGLRGYLKKDCWHNKKRLSDYGKRIGIGSQSARISRIGTDSHTVGISRIDTGSHIVVGVFKNDSYNAVRNRITENWTVLS